MKSAALVSGAASAGTAVRPDMSITLTTTATPRSAGRKNRTTFATSWNWFRGNGTARTALCSDARNIGLSTSDRVQPHTLGRSSVHLRPLNIIDRTGVFCPYPLRKMSHVGTCDPSKRCLERAARSWGFSVPSRQPSGLLGLRQGS